MRPGLVAVGVVFVVLGAAVIAAVLISSDAPTLTRTGTVRLIDLTPGENRTITLPATPSPSADLTLHWIASNATRVEWFASVSCTQSPVGWCFQPKPAASWFSNTSGYWSYSGTAASIYGLFVSDPSNVSVNLSATFTENYRASPLPLTLVPLLVVLAAGALLAGTGGVGVYLGLFLPTGVYSSIAGVPEELFDRELEDGSGAMDWEEKPPGRGGAH